MLHASAAAAALWGTDAGTPPSSAAESPAATSKPAAAAVSTGSPAAATFELFRGKGGFTMQRPSNAGWVTAFVRPSLQHWIEHCAIMHAHQQDSSMHRAFSHLPAIHEHLHGEKASAVDQNGS